MLTDSYGCSEAEAGITILFLIVFINIYILMTTLLIGDWTTGVIFWGIDPQVKQTLIALQTIAAICAIILSITKSTSLTIFKMKFWFFVTVYATLFFDLMFTLTTVFHLLCSNSLDEIWAIKTNNKESIAPATLHYYAIIKLAFYFVFKLYAICMMSHFEKIPLEGVNDIERNNHNELNILSASPPSYDQCVMESSPPPPYSVIPK